MAKIRNKVQKQIDRACGLPKFMGAIELAIIHREGNDAERKEVDALIHKLELTGFLRFVNDCWVPA